MNTYKAYKFRIYPNREQKIMIDKTFGCTRFVFNKFLSERKEKYEKYFPSSQVYNRCEYKNEEVKDLSVRKWICPRCGFEHDRDVNASVNVMFEGLKIYMKECII